MREPCSNSERHEISKTRVRLTRHKACQAFHCKDGLSSRGFVVTRLNTYTTIPVHHVDPITFEPALSCPVVAVASPSAIRAWVNLIPESEGWGYCVACIGETTALAAKRLGLKNVYYPTNPGLEGWVNSILEALRVHNRLQKD